MCVCVCVVPQVPTLVPYPAHPSLWPTLGEPDHGREPEERRGAHRHDEGRLPAAPPPPPLAPPAGRRGQEDGGEMLEADGQGLWFLFYLPSCCCCCCRRERTLQASRF